MLTIMSNKNYIDLSDLSEFLINKDKALLTIGNYEMQIIEEVAFLCINKDFIKDVLKIRNSLFKKIPNIEIPSRNLYSAESLLKKVYYNNYSNYKKSILELIDKYKLLQNLYWRITKDQYEEKLQVYKDKALEAKAKVSEYIKADISYKSQLVQVVDLCKNSKRLFESSIVEDQNSLLKFLLSDCVIKEKRLEYQVNSPFNFILDLERSIVLGG